jgi:hypothetical protein
MEFRLCRIFNRKPFIIMFAAFAFVTIFLYLYLIVGSHHEPNGLSIISNASIFSLIVFFYELFTQPSKVKIQDESIMLIEYHYKDLEPGFSFVITHPHRIERRVNVIISRIEKVEYKSNFIEKIFNIGRIKIHGNVRLERKGKPFDKFKVSRTHYIKGIKKFSNVKTQIMQLLPNAEHCEYR